MKNAHEIKKTLSILQKLSQFIPSKLKNAIIYLRYIFLSKFFFSTQIQYVNCPLVLISQIQRSGGTLLSQLFDGSKKNISYPSELTLTNPKQDLEKPKNYYCYKNHQLRYNAESGKYNKQSSVAWDETYDFKFNLAKQKAIFDMFSAVDERDNMNSYFTSFYNSFDNFYLSSADLKNINFIFAFIPRLIMSLVSVRYFFSIYPDGYILSVIRNPKSWLASAVKHSPSYADTNKALELWYESTSNAITLDSKYNNCKLIIFENLVSNTEQEIIRVCNFLDIDFEDIYLTPTFNSKPILSDSSFKPVKGIDKNTISRKVEKDFDETLMHKCMDLYEKAIDIQNTPRNT
jgi:hypothetical protein